MTQITDEAWDRAFNLDILDELEQAKPYRKRRGVPPHYHGAHYKGSDSVQLKKQPKTPPVFLDEVDEG